MIDGKAFDQMSPKLSVTDPQGLGLQTDYPKHLHQAGVSYDGGPVYLEVTSSEQEALAISEGWLLEKPDPTIEDVPRRRRR